MLGDFRTSCLMKSMCTQKAQNVFSEKKMFFFDFRNLPGYGHFLDKNTLFDWSCKFIRENTAGILKKIWFVIMMFIIIIYSRLFTMFTFCLRCFNRCRCFTIFDKKKSKKAKQNKSVKHRKQSQNIINSCKNTLNK